MLIILKINLRRIQEGTCADIVRKMVINPEIHFLAHPKLNQIETGIATQNSGKCTFINQRISRIFTAGIDFYIVPECGCCGWFRKWQIPVSRSEGELEFAIGLNQCIL